MVIGDRIIFLNGVNIHTVETFECNSDIYELEVIKREMEKEGIDTNKVNILNITFMPFDNGSIELDYDRNGDLMSPNLKYSFFVHYVIEG